MTYLRSLRKTEAKIQCDEWRLSFNEGKDPFIHLKIDKADEQLRADLVEMFESIDEKLDSYEFDAKFGLKLYLYMKNLGMTEADAANDEYWIYIQIKVIPDLIYKRWPVTEKNSRDKRLWKDSSRIYLKAIWWYIDIIWAGSAEKTERYFTNLDMSQVLDRSGCDGMRKEIYRALLYVYSEVPEKKRSKELISSVLMLNSTYCTVLEPELMDISLDEYARRIYREVGIDV